MVTNFDWLEDGVIAGSAKPSRPEEINWLYEQGIRAIVSLALINRQVEGVIQQLALEHIFLEVEDFSIPSPEQIRVFFKFVSQMKAAKKPILVHCDAGIGRTGTMLALYLVDCGTNPGQAIGRVGGLETHGQIKLIFDFAGSYGGWQDHSH